MLRPLLLVLVISACSSGGQPVADLASSPLDLEERRDLARADLSAPADLTVTGSSCNGPAECRLYSNNCDGCACQALRNDEIDPVCAGSPVSCFVDPCEGKTVDCVMGHCVVQ
jgi:hypothetical protein